MKGFTTRGIVLALVVVAAPACSGGDSKSSTAPSTTPAPATASFTVTFDENPTPFRSSGCSFSTPQGWFTNVRVQEKSGVAFAVTGLTQKLDGNSSGLLTESFGSRFGACSGATFTSDSIAANGAVCAVVGVCTASSFGSYQFSIAGKDSNDHTLTIDSPVLQFGARSSSQVFSVGPTLAPTPR